MTLGQLIATVIQYGFPALALTVSGWLGVKAARAAAKSQSEGEVAAEKIKAQTATEQVLKGLLEEQRLQFIVPLQEQVNKQGTEIEDLRKSLNTERDQKWDAITYIRSLLAWIGAHISTPMSPLPSAPESIRHHVVRWHTGSPLTATSPPTPDPPPSADQE